MTAAIYARFSSDRQSERSIADQISACEAFARQRGVPLPARVFADEAQSGASMATRAELQALLVLVRARKISVVIAEALDRLSRDQADIALIHRAVKAAGAALITIAEGDVDALHIGLKGTMNHLFLEELARKTRRGLQGVVRDGRSAGGRCYGYRVEPGETRGVRTIDEAEAAIVREIFQRYVGGETARAIAADLNRRGVPSPRGKAWAVTTIQGDPSVGDGILCQELYRGRIVFNRRRFVKDADTGRRRGITNPESEWQITPADHLRIVPESLWADAQRRRRARASEPKPHKLRAARRLLSGLAVCEACGGPMVISGKDRLACANAKTRGTCAMLANAPAPAIEARVLTALKTHLLAPEFIEAAAEAYLARRGERERATARRRGAAEAELAELDRRAARVVDLMEGAGAMPDLVARLEGIEARRAAARATLATLDPPADVRAHPKAAALYRARVERLEAALADADAGQAAADTLAAVRDLIISVTMAPDAGEPNGWRVTVIGQLAALLHLSAENKTAAGGEAGGGSFDPCELGPSVGAAFMGAGAGFEPTTFRL